MRYTKNLFTKNIDKIAIIIILAEKLDNIKKKTFIFILLMDHHDTVISTEIILKSPLSIILHCLQ